MYFSIPTIVFKSSIFVVEFREVSLYKATRVLRVYPTWPTRRVPRIAARDTQRMRVTHASGSNDTILLIACFGCFMKMLSLRDLSQSDAEPTASQTIYP